MSAKEELLRLVDVLSEYECGHLLAAVQKVAAGERFWETDASAFYNEYAKMRSFNSGSIPPGLIPTGPGGEAEIFAPIPIVKSYSGAERISLPAPERLAAPLGETLLQRRSRRDYTGGAISQAQLSSLLFYSCGISGFMPGYGYNRLPLRTFPTSGGLLAPEVYLSIQAVECLPAGLYHYHYMDHALASLRPGQLGPMLCSVALGQPYLESAAVVVLITGNFARLRWKYGERAYRYMCMDIGYLGENLYLVGEALGLGVCAIAGFVDDAIEELLGIDGRDEFILLLTTVGVPAETP